MGKLTTNRARAQDRSADAAQDPAGRLGLTPAELRDGLAKAEPRAQDFVCRVDFNDQVRKEEADGTRLDIAETIAKYRALDPRPGMIADDDLARLRALTRERGERLYAELGIEL